MFRFRMLRAVFFLRMKTLCFRRVLHSCANMNPTHTTNSPLDDDKSQPSAEHWPVSFLPSFSNNPASDLGILPEQVKDIVVQDTPETEPEVEPEQDTDLVEETEVKVVETPTVSPTP